MFMLVISVLGYLFLCAKVGKFFQDKNVVMWKRQACGAIAIAINVLPVIILYPRNYVLMVFGVACGMLGYVTIVYRPKWIVGNR